MSIGSFFSKIATDIEGWFGKHAKTINAAITDAQVAVADASEVATALGEPESVTGVLSKVSDGLTAIDTAVASEASATTLSGQASAATTLVDSLVNSGDIGVKNAQTQEKIDAVTAKVTSVAGVLSTAAAEAPTA